MLGRSMGGGVTLNALVAQPGLVDVGVVYASVSSRFLDNLRHFTIPGRPEAARRCSTGSAPRSRHWRSTASSRRAPTSTGSPSRSSCCTAPATSRAVPLARTTERLLRGGGGEAPARGVPRRDALLHPALAGLHRDHGAVHPGAVPGGLNPGARDCDGGHHTGVSLSHTVEPGVPHDEQRPAQPQGGCRPRLDAVEQGDEAEPLVRPEILRSWACSEAAISPDVTEAPLADESETEAMAGTLPRRRSAGSRPTCGAPPRTATWSSRSPTPRPASCGRTAAA